MFRAFEGKTADEAWRSIASAVCRNDGVSVQASRNGRTREILHATISISNPRQRWVESRNPPMSVAFALAEVVWILSGRNDSAFLNYFNRGLPKFCGDGPAYHGAYGHRLRKHLKFDQLNRAYHSLRNKAESRQVVLQIWDGAIDMPAETGEPQSADIPCNLMSILKVRNGTLEWMQIMRSNDIFRGLPYNFVQFTILQEIMAGWLGLEVGDYNHLSDSLHVYDSDFSKIQDVTPIAISETDDSLALPKAESDAALAELERHCDAIVDERIGGQSLLNLVVKTSLPPAFRSILCVLAAEGARRRREPQIADAIMAQCRSFTLARLYGRWVHCLHNAAVT